MSLFYFLFFHGTQQGAYFQPIKNPVFLNVYCRVYPEIKYGYLIAYYQYLNCQDDLYKFQFHN